MIRGRPSSSPAALGCLSTRYRMSDSDDQLKRPKGWLQCGCSAGANTFGEGGKPGSKASQMNILDSQCCLYSPLSPDAPYEHEVGPISALHQEGCPIACSELMQCKRRRVFTTSMVIPTPCLARLSPQIDVIMSRSSSGRESKEWRGRLFRQDPSTGKISFVTSLRTFDSPKAAASL